MGRENVGRRLLGVTPPGAVAVDRGGRPGFRRLYWLTIFLPLAFIVGLDQLRHTYFSKFWHHWPGSAIATGLVAVAMLLFSSVVFSIISRMEREILSRSEQLRALHEAAMVLTSELSLDTVLQKLVDCACELAGARYGALSVLGEDSAVARFLTAGLSQEERARIGPPPQGRGLLGALATQGKPLRLADLSQDPRSVGFPRHHPAMRSFLGVPLIVKGRTIGALYLTEKRRADGFSPSDEDVVSMLAAHAAIAIENTQLYAQTQRLAVLEERERIGMDLHDGAIQSLYAVGLALEDCAGQLEQEPARVQQRLGKAIDNLNGIIRDIRNYIFGLHPQALDGRHLRQSLATLVAELKINALANTTLSIDEDLDGQLSAEQALQLLHLAREALANILKHARASAVQVRLTTAGSRLVLSVHDNGVGFDPARAEGEAHHGLRNMQERALALGGTLRIESARGQGTTVAVEIPLAGGEGAG
ncbi:MAG: GAF domain-containing sensor histidine kinase [Deinococcus sp.]|nr:GAF domain-containing sensor histidine kinase [Deinococcus sp.]